MYIRDREGKEYRFSCYVVDYEKFPGAIPCGSYGEAYFTGKEGRIWYVEREEKLLMFRGVNRLAVQIELRDGAVFPFSLEKKALMNNKVEFNYIEILLICLMNFCAIFLVWIFVISQFRKFMGVKE